MFCSPLLLSLVLHPTFGSLRVSEEILPYHPRPGDLIFYDDRHPLWTVLFAFAGSGRPLHMGLVVEKDDKTLAVLEAGPDDSLTVQWRDLATRLRQFRRDFGGTIQIRRCKMALSSENSRELTRFAAVQEGKRYAVGRLLLQGTWLRVRGPLEPWLAGTVLDRNAWICSELSVAGATVAGLMDRRVPANATYPRDLVNDRRHDLSAAYYPAGVWLQP